MIKRSRVAAVTRTAKQMVLDVRKERLIEDFVKELMVDLKESRETIISLRRAAHEQDTQEMAGEWQKVYRRLSDEVDRLKLAQGRTTRRARTVERDGKRAFNSPLSESWNFTG